MNRASDTGRFLPLVMKRLASAFDAQLLGMIRQPRPKAEEKLLFANCSAGC